MTDSSASTAFVFPGQGSQKIGMLSEAHAQFPEVRDTFQQASDTLGYDMWQLVSSGEQEQLNLTETTQPVLLTSSVALWRAWQAQGGCAPVAMAGHSLGEFSALVCAGVLDFADAVQLVRQRGAFMQAAVPVGVGAMAAIIGVEDDTIRAACDEAAAQSGEVVSAVNYNSPGQVVIAGHKGAVDAAIEILKEGGAKRAMPLPVSAPFHTSLMKPAGERLAEAMAGLTLSAPQIPVVHNVHAKTESDPEVIRALMVEQIYSPVLWTDCLQGLISLGATQFVECGPGKVLGGLNRRIDKSLQSFALETPTDLEAARTALA